MLYGAGFLASHWPSVCGGRDGSPLEPIILAEAQATFDAPRVLNGAAISITGPTIMAWGTDDQKRTYLPRMLTAEDVWCLGFSEPGAGSDLASLSTRGELRDGTYLLTGQKVWTSYADFARWGLFLVRTDPGSQRHHGLTALVVDMSAPGITVRPLKQMTGDAEFCEVFLDACPVPASNVLGAPGDGWRVVLTALGHERGTLLAFETQIHMRKCVARMGSLLRGATGDRAELLREEAARAWTDVQIMRLLCLRTLAEEADSPVASVLKLFATESAQRIYETMLDVQSDHGVLTRGIDNGQWQYRLLLSRSYTIASGTSEVQRNIVAERLLGLPR
jgi:alkylation response protein AidB-like acyl-CoA dehydrogenase